MPSVDLSQVTVDSFVPHIGTDFDAVLEQGGERVTELKLIDAKSAGKATIGDRIPFRLLFQGPADVPLSQGMLTLTHADLGSLDIFIVPVRGDTESRTYEAVFS